MRHSSYPALLALTLILTACGGGGSNTAPDNVNSKTNTAANATSQLPPTSQNESAAITRVDLGSSASISLASNAEPPDKRPAAVSETRTVTPTSSPTPVPRPTLTQTWTRCADEGGTCSFTGTKLVRYGLNDEWATSTATGSITCNNFMFGATDSGASKVCDYADAPDSFHAAG